jgi:hypothetical protein
MHAYVARGLSFVGQHLEPYEVLTVHRFPPADILAMIDRGIITDGKTILTVLFAARRGLI